MNKTVIVAVMAVGATVVLSPKMIGNNAHNKLKSLVSEFNSKPGYQLAIKEQKVGWLSSEHVLSFSLDLNQVAPNLSDEQRQQMAGNNLESLSFDIELNLHFGPFLGKQGIGLIAWNAWIEDKPENLTILDDGVDYIYHMNGKARLSGDISYTDVIPAFEVGSAELGGNFHLSGWHGVAKPVDGEVQYRGELGSLSFNSQINQFVVENLALDWLGEFDLATLANQHYGKFKTELAIEQFTYSENQNTLINMQEFSLFGDTKVAENEILDMEFGYRVRRLMTPFDGFENIRLAFALNNISGDFVREYQSLLFKYANEPDPKAILTALEKPFIAALEAKPEFHVTRIGFEHSAGELISNATIKLSDYDVNAEELADENFWLNNLVVNGSVSLPKTLYRELGKKILISRYRHDPGTMHYSETELQQAAEQAIEPMLQSMVEQGLLQEEGELLQMNLNVTAGEAILNGNPIPLAALSASN